MKCLLIDLLIFLTVVNSASNKNLYLPHLPVGEYRVKFIGIIRCDSVKSKEQIIYNYYLSKTSVNSTEIKGNATYLIPMDDSLDLEINLAIKDSVGGWKENAHMFKAPKACSSLKMFLGERWTPMMGALGIINATCPIPAGFYKASSLKNDGNVISILLQKFFYGTYKVRYALTKNNEVYGCTTYVIEVKRPWETD